MKIKVIQTGINMYISKVSIIIPRLKETVQQMSECSEQLRMFHMERRSRNALIIITSTFHITTTYLKMKCNYLKGD